MSQMVIINAEPEPNQSINQYLHGALKGPEEGLSTSSFLDVVPFSIQLVFLFILCPFPLPIFRCKANVDR